MNREQAKGAVKHAALIAAFAGGAKIEYKAAGGHWYDCVEPGFRDDREYRIKPEPRSLFCIQRANESGKLFVWSYRHDRIVAEEALEAAQRQHPDYELVEYIEVMK